MTREAEITVTIVEACSQKGRPYSDGLVEYERTGESIPGRAEHCSPKRHTMQIGGSKSMQKS